jgi:hypothetical protein
VNYVTNGLGEGELYSTHMKESSVG